MELVALWHVESSQTRDRTHVTSIGRWFLSATPQRKSYASFKSVRKFLGSWSDTVRGQEDYRRVTSLPLCIPNPTCLHLIEVLAFFKDFFLTGKKKKKRPIHKNGWSVLLYQILLQNGPLSVVSKFQNISNSFWCGEQREAKHISSLFYEICFRNV